MFKSNTREIPTTERFIDIVLERVGCEKHGTIKQEPCYILPISITKNERRTFNVGVCNWRARQAGFVGEPAPAPKSRLSTPWNRK